MQYHNCKKRGNEIGQEKCLVLSVCHTRQVLSITKLVVVTEFNSRVRWEVKQI
jgi:hypothetical protein